LVLEIVDSRNSRDTIHSGDGQLVESKLSKLGVIHRSKWDESLADLKELVGASYWLNNLAETRR
jgi:hypothetical protein